MKYTKGELKIKKYLQKKHIKFKPQYRTIINKRIHIFDFAIIDKKGVKIFIEYDGEQHYKPISIFGGEEGFKERQKRDKEKDIFCKVNNILLIRVPYYEKNINNFLNQKLKNIKKQKSIEVKEYIKPLKFYKTNKYRGIKKIINLLLKK